MKTSDMKIAYEPHPVTPERKAELNKQGYRIIDARFKPADIDDAEVKPTKRGKPAVTQDGA